MKQACAHALAALACCLAVTASANPRLEEIIVTSSRVEMPLRQVGTSVSVLTQSDIHDRGFANLSDVLRYEPAVSVTNTGGAGKATSLRIRGENGYRTRVLMDGIDITDVSSPQAGPRLEHLMSAGIERVEILRGPQGLMYGADAGGLVSVTTRHPEAGFGGEISGEFGRFGTGQLAADLGGSHGDLDYSLFGSRFETDGFNSRTTDTVLRDEDGYENTALHGRLGWNIADTWRAEVVAHSVEGESEFDSCNAVSDFAPTDDCSDDYSQDSWRASLRQRGETLTHLLAYSESGTEREFYSEGLTSFAADGDLRKVEYLGTWQAAGGTALAYGLDLLEEAIDDGTFDRERDQRGYYLEYQGELAGALYFTAGARYDDNDDFGSYTTYRLSTAYVIPVTGGELKFKGVYGTGFRAPSLYEIAYNRGDFAYPPASETELDVEESEGVDLGIAWYDDAGWFLEAVYFDQRVEDEIYFDLDIYSGYLQGDGTSKSRGVELIGEWPLGGGFTLSGNYTYNDTEDADGAPRLRVPEHLANLGLGYRPAGSRFNVNLFLRVARDGEGEFGSEPDDHEVLDLNASYRVSDRLEIYGRVENLTDESYREVATYKTPGAAGYAGLRYSF